MSCKQKASFTSLCNGISDPDLVVGKGRKLKNIQNFANLLITISKDIHRAQCKCSQ